MCIFLTRHFSCMEEGKHVTHTHQYLNRCANPAYADCIKPNAILTETERYNTPCHECTGKFIHPKAQPVLRQCSAPGEDQQDAHHAALSYVEAMCNLMILSALPAWPETSEPFWEIAHCFGEMEMACRFNKDHFDNRSTCFCSEANQHPELHNICAGFRQTIARYYLFPWRCRFRAGASHPEQELTWNRVTHGFTAPRYDAAIQQYWDRLRNQPDLKPLDHLKKSTTLGDIQVIPFYIEPWDREAREDRMQRYFNDFLPSEADIPDWIKDYNASLPPHLRKPGDNHRDELGLREKLMLKVISLVASDTGLSYDRALSIAKIFYHVRIPDPEDIKTDGTIGSVVGKALARVVKHGKTIWGEKAHAGTVGYAWFEERRWENAEYYMRRNRAMRLEDERSREDAIENTVIPLTREEVGALPDDKKTCIVCFQTLGHPPDRHAGVSLKCPAKHLIGMNCWTKTCREKRLVQTDVLTTVIKCIQCVVCKVGDWAPPVNNLSRLDTIRFETRSAILPNQ